MGVEGERFRRTRPYPGGRTVIAVGRRVEKKALPTCWRRRACCPARECGSWATDRCARSSRVRRPRTSSCSGRGRRTSCDRCWRRPTCSRCRAWSPATPTATRCRWWSRRPSRWRSRSSARTGSACRRWSGRSGAGSCRRAMPTRLRTRSPRSWRCPSRSAWRWGGGAGSSFSPARRRGRGPQARGAVRARRLTATGAG